MHRVSCSPGAERKDAEHMTNLGTAVSVIKTIGEELLQAKTPEPPSLSED